jgi:hypothetical protein
LLNRRSADRMFFEMKGVIVSCGDLAQDAHGLFGHFRSHPITRKHNDS